MAIITETILGGVAGFFVAILTALGMYRKLEKLEEKTVTKETCDAKHALVNKMQDDLTYIRERVDELYDHLTNRK